MMSDDQRVWLCWGLALGLLVGAPAGAVGGWGLEILAAFALMALAIYYELRGRRR